MLQCFVLIYLLTTIELLRNPDLPRLRLRQKRGVGLIASVLVVIWTGDLRIVADAIQLSKSPSISFYFSSCPLRAHFVFEIVLKVRHHVLYYLFVTIFTSNYFVH